MIPLLCPFSSFSLELVHTNIIALTLNISIFLVAISNFVEVSNNLKNFVVSLICILRLIKPMVTSGEITES